MSDLTEGIGQIVKDLRLDKGWSVKELCQRIGYSTGILYGIECGSAVGIHSLHVTCHALDARTPSILFRAEGVELAGTNWPAPEMDRTTHLAIIGQTLTEQREFVRLSAAELAQHTGTTESHILAIESGRNWPSMDSLKSMCDALELYLGDFFTLVENSYLNGAE